MFLTTTPKDENNFRNVAYSMMKMKGDPLNVDVASISDEEILAKLTFKKQIKTEHLGVCSEEYKHICDAIVKHVFNGNIEEQRSNGTGIFGDLHAWILATEEQGRITLHGHWLLFVKGWKKTMKTLQAHNIESIKWKQEYEQVVNFFLYMFNTTFSL